MTNWTASSLWLLLLLHVVVPTYAAGWGKDGHYRLLSDKVKSIIHRRSDTNNNDTNVAERASNRRLASLDDSSRSPFLLPPNNNPFDRSLQKPPQNPPTAWLQEQHHDALANYYRGGSSSSPDDNLEFFPIASLLLAGSVVVAFHLQSPQSHDQLTLSRAALQQPYRLWTHHWIHLSEAHFFSNIVNICTHGILCEKVLGVVNFLQATLSGILSTSLCGVLLLPFSDKLALAHDQGVGFSGVVCFWMGLVMGTPAAFWWHRIGCFVGIFLADVLMLANQERGTLHHWIGVVNGLLYAAWQQKYWPQLKLATTTIRMKKI